MARLQDPDIRLQEVESLVAQDVSLSYRLLRYINSAFFALPQPVESIGRAIVYVGLAQIRQWTSLLAMTGLHDKPKELMRTALARGKMCGLLGAATGNRSTDVFFTVGLFSALGALLDLPLPEVIEGLPLNEQIQTALLHYHGVYGQALRCTLAYETCRWLDVSFAGLEEERIASAYLDSVQWSIDTFKWLSLH